MQELMTNGGLTISIRNIEHLYDQDNVRVSFDLHATSEANPKPKPKLKAEDAIATIPVVVKPEPPARLLMTEVGATTHEAVKAIAHQLKTAADDLLRQWS